MFAKQLGRGGDYEHEEEQEELLLEPNVDVTRKAQGIGGAIPLSKQVGRPVEVDLDEDEHFTAPADTEAIPNDPSKPRVTSLPFDKQAERFKYEPQDSIDEQPELLLPAELKPIEREKVLFKMDKGLDRFPLVQKSVNLDFNELAKQDGEFRGTDL